MLDVRLHDGLPPAGLRDEWLTLLDRAGDLTAFHRPDYLEAWVTHLGTSETTRTCTFHREDGTLVGVVAESHDREGSPDGPREVVRFLGGEDVTDYRGPVAAPEHRKGVARAWMSTLAGDRHWDHLVLAGLPEDGMWGGVIESAATDAGLAVADRATYEVCPRIDLSGGHDAYLERLPSKRRREQARKARKLGREIGPVQLVEVDHADLDAGFDAFFGMAAGAADEKARFFDDDRMEGFFRALGDALPPEVLRLHVLDVAGTPGAAAVSLVWDREWGLYNTAFDQTLASHAPGIVLAGELIRIAAEAEHDVFDLLQGDEAYKHRLGAVDRGLERLTITRT